MNQTGGKQALLPAFFSRVTGVEGERMAYFPIFIELQDRPCLVAGGGKVALRKARALLSFGARVTVVARAFLPEFECLPAVLIRRRVLSSDLRGMALAVDATSDSAAGEMLSGECARRKIPLNVVDRPDLCSFFFPAVLRRGPLTAAVSTGGASPTAAAWTRDRLDEALPARFEEILEQMGRLRARARGEPGGPDRRAALLRRCFAAAVEKEGPLSEEELLRLWEEKE